MANLSKSIIVSSVASVASLLDTQYNDIKQHLSTIATPSSAEKAELQAAITKVKYFSGLSELVAKNDKAVSALYFIVKNAKKDPSDLLKEIAINSYSLNKFCFIISGVANSFYNYDLSDMSASNIMAVLDFIIMGKVKFSMRQYRDQMTAHKEKADKKADNGFTQTNQALKLCERLGIVSYTGGKISMGYGEYKINTENELVKYLKSIFTKDKETQNELDLSIEN
ncbi:MULTISPECIES: hypothetical protein [Xenorhabdus]|uniref:hypothetical protein n=1 Tax=Xenorhabdus TaxID=626 RepID=UPI00064989BE|nr:MULTISPECIES: hypothetical protein [Xenorhabdus]KLU17126.1 hypothetical protein AAY47_01525 [Xenorhabdus griffiniae]KOP31679.1 hypothetical protein AFK69_19475 [Xenorhabdus sp. GDc328]